MDYSFVSNITIYCAAGNLGDTLTADQWRENLLWRGVLYFPHRSSDFAAYVAAGNAQVYLSRGGNWDILRRYIPAFASANGVFNTRGQSSLYSLSYSGYFPGMTGISPGCANLNLHIVTCQGEKAAYVYATSGAGDSGAVYAEIQNNGDLVMDTAKRLALPRFAATSSYAYLHGCLLDSGVTENQNIITSAMDFHINAAWREPTLAGLHIAFFNRDPTPAANAVEFLNKWPLNGKSRFDASGFLKGVITGRRLRRSGASGESVAESETGGAGVYHENSFLSGLSAGFLTGEF